MTPDQLKNLLVSCGVRNISDHGTNFMAPCPYHRENNPSWGIQKTAPHLFGCFACHAKGSIVKLLVDKLQVSYTRAAQLAEVALSKHPSRDIVIEVSSANAEESLEDQLDMLVPSPLSIRYLLKRGVQMAMTVKADVRFDYADNRVIFPWRINDKLCGATGRTILKDPEVPKVLPYMGMAKGSFLYFPRAPIEGAPMVLVEGEIDSLRVAQALPGVTVAATGFGVFTAAQKSLTLKIRPPKVTAMFDFDEAGEDLTRKVVAMLDDCVPVSSVPWHLVSNQNGAKLDPASVSDQEIRFLVADARGVLYL